MSSSWLLVASALLLGAPWLMMPRRQRPPEIRGLLRLLWWVNAFYCRFWHKLEVRATAPLPEFGPAILIANHTCGIDPMVLQAGCKRVLGFLIAKEFYEYWAFRPMCRLLRCIPVRRDGRDLSAMRSALRALEEGRVVPIFPEGRITPESGRTIGEAKPGVAFLVVHARVPVIPAYIWGTPATKKIWTALLTPSRAHVVFGPPIPFEDLGPDGPADRERLAAVTGRLMGAIRSLRDEVCASRENGFAFASTAPQVDSISEPQRLAERPGAVPSDRATVRGT